MLAFLQNWFRGRSLERLRFVMYTRRGCHLCDEAWRCLLVEQARARFQLESIDVDSDPELAARYGHEVPVVTVDGKVRFRGIVNPVLLARLLRAEEKKPGEAHSTTNSPEEN